MAPEELRALLAEAAVPVDEAAREARGAVDGPVTAIRLDARDGDPLWVVGIVSDVPGGEVTTRLVDARTGELLDRP